MTNNDAAELSDMITDLMNAGVDPKEAKKILDGVISDMDYNGSTVQDAMASLHVEEQIQEAKDKKYGKPANQGTPSATSTPMTKEEYLALWDGLKAEEKAGTITNQELKELGAKLDALYVQHASLQEAQNATNQAPITMDQSKDLQEQLLQKVNAGKMTFDEFSEAQTKIMQMAAQGAKFKDVQASVGLDPGTLATEAAANALEIELRDVYAQAAKEMQAKLDQFSDELTRKMNEKRAALDAGNITQEEYDAWVKGQLMQQKIMQQKVDVLATTMTDANKKAMGMVNGETYGVFAENANYQAYQLTKDTGLNLMFSVYDEETVKNLIKNKPELLPRKVVNGKKDEAWNREIIARSITQGILQGESIKDLAKRVARDTASTNMNAMVRYARTAMTSAQNAGRQEMLHRAKGMGIKCKKCWLATLDSRTRDAHAKLDGQKVDVDKPFKSDMGDLMYPGDMSSSGSVPANLYNCRCTLTYEYEGYPNDPTADMRRDNETGEIVADMNYVEWKTVKKAGALNELNAAKLELAEAQKQVGKAKINESKKYSGIWKDDVTLADFQDKKDAIQGKIDYYDAEIAKYKQAQAEGHSWATDEKIKDLEKKEKLVQEYKKNGELLEKRDKALKAVQDVYDKVGLQVTAAAPETEMKKAKAKPKAAKKTEPAAMSLQTAGEKKTPFSPEAYTKARKDGALWTTNKRKVDDKMRERTGEVWRKATSAQKDAIYEYTRSYSKFNEPLRGIEYGTNAYKGVGKTDLNPRQNGKVLNAMTDIIDKCWYDHDMWLQRGVGYRGMDKFFNIPLSTLEHGSEADLKKALLGTTPTEYGFMSMGSAKGEGFSGDITLNIYAPAGTKMMYAEPFSAYGRGDERDWDGRSKQSSYGGEFETIMQQGTKFRVTKVERSGSYGHIYIDIEVIGQDKQQRWKP